MRTTARWVLLAAGGALVVSTQAQAQNGNGYSNNSEMRIRISKEPLPLPVSMITRVDVKGDDKTIDHREKMPVRAFRLEDYTPLSEPQIAWFMVTRDTSQIEFARLAQTKVVDPNVRTLAGNIEANRVERRDKTLGIIGDKDHVGSEPKADDYERTRRRELYSELDGMASGPKWDAAYLQSQYFLTQNEIEVYSINRQFARDNELRRMVDKRVRDLVSARTQIQELCKNLGVNLP